MTTELQEDLFRVKFNSSRSEEWAVFLPVGKPHAKPNSLWDTQALKPNSKTDTRQQQLRKRGLSRHFHTMTSWFMETNWKYNTGGWMENKLSAFKGRRSQPTGRMLMSQDHDKFLQGELKPPTSKKSETRSRDHQLIFCRTQSHFHVRSLKAYLNVVLGSFLSNP